ncbi:PD-(D/E)XK nuclease family protein [Bythopirellula goksoeyrii]|uniref:ATP-dependent helicase/deoxyribonuclease subunit B n=1 Tax=Bythopirellula goksoeyrii TaxID=1400387 RepID=A0A5B9QC53_9BACT|nr:PD-(D/E)XK nuclease family protein [Bythopirellula goksoeyrii]QEG35180.1 ATP-dependent helicase/deoxyribonuclease subunit B [Bythopirellula goksoeyrii]
MSRFQISNSKEQGVNLILGPTRSGKTTRLAGEYVHFLADWQQDCRQPGGIWIGPSQGAVGQVRDLLATKCESALLNPQVVTFARFAEQVIARGRRRIRPIGPWEKQRILQQLIVSLLGQEKLSYFAAVAHTPGFVRQVAQFIGELKRRDVWAEQFRQRARSDRDRDIGVIYSAYQHFLTSQDLYDAEGRFWAAREQLHAESDAQWGLVVVDGFTDFTAAQHDILRLLAERSERLSISLLAEAAEGASSPGRELLFGRTKETLLRLQGSLPTAQTEFLAQSRNQSPGIAHVERQLFRDEQELSNQPTGLAILAANSVQGEIQEIARRIKVLLLSGDTQPEKIAVVFRNLDEVAPRIKEVCADFGLPYWLDSQATLKQTPLVRTLLKILRLQEKDWPFDLLLDLTATAATQRIAGEVATSSNWRVAAERSIRRAQLPAGRTLLMEQLRLWSDSGEQPSQESQDAAIALKIFESLEGMLGELPAHARLSTWIRHLERLVVAFGIAGPHWESLRHALDVTSAKDVQLGVAEAELSVAQILHLVEQIASEIPQRVTHDSIGQVRFLSAANARNLEVRHLFLAGLSEQSYSSGESSARLYSQQELGQFISDEQNRGPTPEEQAGDAMLLFYEMVTRPSETLTLSYPALDDKGQAMSPSPFLTELERCFAEGSIFKVTMAVGELASEVQAPLSRSDWRLTGIGSALAGDPKWLAGLAKLPVGQAILHGVESVGLRSQRDMFGPYEGILASENVRVALSKQFNEEHLWSPSRLETYATCPFRFFAGTILRLEPLGEIALRSDHLRRGSLLHQVLAAVHQQHGKPPAAATEPELISRFSSAMERIISENPLGGLNEALREIERREVLTWAPQYAKQEMQYQDKWKSFDQPLHPAHFEVRFGPLKYNGSDEYQDTLSQPVPFILDLENEQIQLTGQIDRIDMGQVHGVTVFTIIDYKSGQGVKLKPTEMEAGRQLQLPLYALAAEKLLLVDQHAKALATGYWNIKDTGFAGGRDGPFEFRTPTKSGLEDSPGWDSLQSAILARIEEMVHGIRAGEFPVYNENQQCTASCDFSKICRVAQIRSLEKVWPQD